MNELMNNNNRKTQHFIANVLRFLLQTLLMLTLKTALVCDLCSCMCELKLTTVHATSCQITTPP